MRSVLLAGLIALSGCADPNADPGTADAVPAVTALATAAIEPGDSETPAARPQLILTPDGLMRAPEGGGPPNLLEFGTPRMTVENLVERAIGASTDRSRNVECGAGPMEFTQFGSLTLNFQDHRFVGWFAGEGTRIPTDDGILPGVTRARLESELTVTMIADTTLEGEFEYAGSRGEPIGGFFDGGGRDARVTALYAGINCFFR